MNVGYFQRWYDLDVALSETVHTLEALSSTSQTLFGLLLNDFIDRIVQVRGHQFYSQLEIGKLVGLLKAKQSRRWYDQESLLHKAFNKLYSLSDADKSLIAKQLQVPIRLVRLYEKECLQKCQTPELEDVYKIIEGCFNQNEDSNQAIYDTEGMTFD